MSEDPEIVVIYNSFHLFNTGYKNSNMVSTIKALWEDNMGHVLAYHWKCPL